ncbi:hypothetical protein BJV77DRAFT_1064955 [Russula vinacea]|nr:hypothetical protein BJV77DRAFT_1064955 [Russula vinacea]
MSYNATIQNEAQYVNSLGPNVTKDKFHAIYNGILAHWFPSLDRPAKLNTLSYVMKEVSATPFSLSQSNIL